MSSKFPEKRIRNSEQVYCVFREAVLRDDGVYSKQLFDEGLVGSREDANRLLSVLTEKGILKKGKRTRAQFYVPDRKGLKIYTGIFTTQKLSYRKNFLLAT